MFLPNSFCKVTAYTHKLLVNKQGWTQDFPQGVWTNFGGGRGPPMWALFGENICENERIWSRRRAYVGPLMISKLKRKIKQSIERGFIQNKFWYICPVTLDCASQACTLQGSSPPLVTPDWSSRYNMCPVKSHDKNLHFQNFNMGTRAFIPRTDEV